MNDEEVEERQKQLWNRITPGVERRIYVHDMEDTLLASPGMIRVLAERRRHFEKEYTIEHDRAEHKRGGLVLAARSYIWAAVGVADRIANNNPGRRFLSFIPFQWPWTDEDWKPNLESPTENLVRAASLLIAEIDRRTAEGLE